MDEERSLLQKIREGYNPVLPEILQNIEGVSWEEGKGRGCPLKIQKF